MEARIVIKNINFIQIDKKDIRIKIYHDNVNLISDIIWDYKSNDIINWKFIFDYNPIFPIDFVVLENDILEQNVILGHGVLDKNFIINNSELNSNLFPEPDITNIEIFKNNKITCNITIEKYIILKKISKNYKCGSGWSLPDDYPQLNIFPYKKINDIFQHIRIIENTFSDELQNDNYSNAFTTIINDTNNKPPICFGIIGPDNYGKSRLLQNLKKKLSLNKDNVIIYFNPWNFEAADIIWASILISIHDALELKFGKFNLKMLRIKKSFFPNKFSIFKFFFLLSLPVILLILFFFNNYFHDQVYGILLSISLILSSLYFLKNYYYLISNLLFSISDLINKTINKPDWKKQLGFMNEIKEEFFDFINPLVKNYNCKLILLIDDLDKCSIEKIYSVIKVLSLLKYSDCPIYIFLSYDSVKIMDALTSYYKNKNLVNTYEGKNLLDKLINIPFCLPEKSIVENISLIDKYLQENPKDISNSPILISKKIELENIEILSESPKLSKLSYLNMKENNLNILNQLEKILEKQNNLTFFQLENYYRYIIKMEMDEKFIKENKKIIELKKIIYQKYIEIKKDFAENLYIGLDKEEIELLQKIIEETKHSGNYLTNYEIIKIINLYVIARFLLPNYLKNKKNKLLHLIIITENWQNIIIEIYKEIKKIKINMDQEKIKDCFETKELVFFYMNNDKFSKNDELIIYLSKFDIKIMDYIELESYLINLDRCLI